MIDILRPRPRDSCYGIILKLFQLVDMLLNITCIHTQYHLGYGQKYFRSFNYSIAVPRPPADT